MRWILKDCLQRSVSSVGLNFRGIFTFFLKCIVCQIRTILLEVILGEKNSG